jgi:hypothetical protein
MRRLYATFFYWAIKKNEQVIFRAFLKNSILSYRKDLIATIHLNDYKPKDKGAKHVGNELY